MTTTEFVGVASSIYMVLVALLLGSFINMAADRLPRRESLVHPGSHCRACGRRLNFVDLVPVAGYLIRAGRCASCGAPIGAASPVVEALAGAAMAVPVFWLGPLRGGVAGLVLVTLLGVTVVGLARVRAGRLPAR